MKAKDYLKFSGEILKRLRRLKLEIICYCIIMFYDDDRMDVHTLCTHCAHIFCKEFAMLILSYFLFMMILLRLLTCCIALW